MQKLVSFFSALVVCALMAGPANAYVNVPITPAGAADLKKLIEDNLQWRLDLAKVSGQGLAMEGALTVTPKESFYEVTFSGAALNIEQQGKLAIGTVVLHAVPGENGEWLVSGALPSSMTFYDRANTPVAELNAEKQKLGAAWLPERDMWPRLDATYQNVKIKSLKADFPSVSLGTLSLVVNMKANGDGTWSGPSALDASGISIDAPGKAAVKINIATLSSATAYERLDMTRQTDIKKSLQELTAGGKTPTEAEVKARLAGILTKAPGMADSMRSSFDMTGFSLHQQESSPTQPPVDFSVDTVSLRSNLLDARAEKAQAGFSSTFDGIKISSIPADFAGLVPQTASIEMHAGNLPLNKIISTLAETLLTTGDQTAVRSAILTLPKLLQDSGAALTVSNTYSKSPDLEADVAGKIDAAANTALGATGKITLTMKKLDQTVQKLRDLAVKPGADLKMMGYANSLAVFQMMGQSAPAPDGTPARVYNLELMPDGRILLNGVNIKALVGPKTAPSPATTPAPTQPSAPAAP